MVPVPEWIPQVVLPLHGETYSEAWGPLSTVINGGRVTGVLVLSNLRVLFVRNDGSSLSQAHLQFAIPLNLLERALGDQRKQSGILVLNHLEFEFRTAAGPAPGTFAQGIARRIIEARNRRISELHLPPPPLPPPPPGPATGVVHEREVIREVVRIPCRFCGTLVDQLAAKCSSCGAVPR